MLPNLISTPLRACTVVDKVVLSWILHAIRESNKYYTTDNLLALS
jgi:hypothetical protein